MSRWVAGVVLLGLVAMTFPLRERIVNALTFHPTRGIDVDPARLGIAAQDARFEAEDGVALQAFFLASPGAGRALLFLHGNAGNASHRLPNAAALAALGIHVLLPDYRGYGRSAGSPSEAGVYRDARASLAHLTRERGLPAERIVVFGRSLGGAVAVELAAERPLAGVILESTFPSLAAVARAHFGPPGAWFAGDRFASAAKVERVRAPLLFFHGDRDEVVPFPLGRRLFESARQPKTFVRLAGAGHNDTVRVGGAAYLERIRRFLDEVAPEPGR